jgi:uncharacterized membrane protein
MVSCGVLGAIVMLKVDRSNLLPRWLLEDWLYNGGGTGARTLLGAVASSTIGVAGTVFSITIAALSLAAGQMGPRLLRNFTRDRGNQITLGIFLGTFAYALMVLRAVRTQSEGEFVPHISLSIAIALALVCVATLVYFVGHMSSRINVDTVIELVSDDVRSAIDRLATDQQQPDVPGFDYWRQGSTVTDPRHGYLQHINATGLADWAAQNKTSLRLLVRPGDYVFPGAPIALINPFVDGVEDAIHAATALGTRQVGAADIEFAIRQLVEVAVRALSPSINDPYTAISVLERLGASLCSLVDLHLPTNVFSRDERVVLVLESVDYDGLVDASFHMIRQNATSNPAVMIRILEVLTAVASCEPDLERIKRLRRHANLVLTDAKREIPNRTDVDDVISRHRYFEDMIRRRAASPGRDGDSIPDQPTAMDEKNSA